MEETRCEKYFVQTATRRDDGHYSVGLPKSPDGLAQLGESKSTALRRLMLLERRLARDETLKQEYHAFMTDYLSRGHMRRIIENPADTKVSYSSSKRFQYHYSLIQDDLRTILMRSRLYPIVLIADVEKMFRQVWMNSEDLSLQRILWRFSPDEPVETYELLTVTYGTKPAPFLATRTLKQLSIDEVYSFPLAAKRICKDVYMDDVITGANNIAEARIIRCQLDGLLQKGGFRLRKWVSNNEDVLTGVEEDNLALPRDKTVDFDAERTVKTLGLVWEPRTDTFLFKIQYEIISDSSLTKRKVLSRIAKIFDPLGLVGPVITKAKMFMQQIWELKGHFLIGSSLQAVPDKDFTNTSPNRLTHWQLIQQQLQHFWRRWHTEYLSQLQARVKNWQPAINIETGRLVIIVDENQPSMKWRMARIHQTHPGKDGVVRVVTLRTATGYVTRPVTKICLLPLAIADEPDTSQQQ
ncbi:uncharacterized protein LOC131439025 [Malaya genurostris]|uniref:uncharacterized protein LOC131439025 n=1 Tax=Malaya genurostris TaxID=325434 RepID=UPI0026F38244|nr:uncharacterized protein LOC131439025 [Malaya genurostris]